MTTSTRILLLCGVIAGPLFTVAWILEGSTRSNYDALRHPISSLSIGELGWTQATTFIVTGLLTPAFAFGLRSSLKPLGGSKWAPILIGAAGIGLLGAGFFATDPMNGYPPGTPVLPLQYSVPGRLHRLFSALFFLGIPLASCVLARRFSRWGQSGWAVYSTVSGLAFLAGFVLTSAGFVQADGLADVAGLFQRITITIGWGWLTLLAVHLLRNPRQPTGSSHPLCETSA